MASHRTPPIEQTRLLRGGRPRKRWRWVGAFAPGLYACAASVQIGPARQTFWAVKLAGEPDLRERTRLLPRRGEVVLSPGRLLVRDLGVELDLALTEEDGVTALCPHGRGWVWTRKQAGIAAHGTLRVDGGAERALRARAVIDDTCGHHARVTEWRWSAGVGESPDGTLLAWNLVSGVNDPPLGSERAVWVAGRAHEPAPVRIARDLSSIEGEGGSRLEFRAAAERSRRDRLLLVSSDYRAPFGEFAGTLPGPIPLAAGLGVMEHHRARW